jgi:predicted nucleic acid-binding protein
MGITVIMGVRGVWTYFRNLFVSNPVSLESNTQTIGIDMLSLIYTYRTLIDDLVLYIKSLEAAGHTVVCVWDGVAPKEKQEIIKQRRCERDVSLSKKNTLSTYLEEYGDQLDEQDLKSLTQAITSLEWQGWHLSYKKKQEIQNALGSMEHRVADGEADDLLLEMAFSGKLDCIITLDSDLFVMGAPKLWRLLRKRTWYIEEIKVERICGMCDIRLGDLQDAAYLAGWDRCHLTGHVYMHFDKAMEYIKQNKIEDLIKDQEESYSRLEVIKAETHGRWKEVIRRRKLA